MTPLAQKSLRIIALTLAAIILSALALAQTTNHPSPPCKALTTQPKPLPTHKPVPCARFRPETSVSLGAFLPTHRYPHRQCSLRLQHCKHVPPPPESSAPFARASVPGSATPSTWATPAPPSAGTYNAGFESMGTPSNLIIPSNMYELSLSYLAEKHVTPRLSRLRRRRRRRAHLPPRTPRRQRHRLRPPTAPSFPPSAFVLSGVGGIGVDYLLTSHLSLRAEYRGQLYKFADYGNALPRLPHRPPANPPSASSTTSPTPGSPAQTHQSPPSRRAATAPILLPHTP